jgi:hypothetical protein
VNVTARVSYGRCGRARFRNQISIGPGSFSDSGDSGSAILDTNTKQPVALLFAGSSTITLGNPIGAVLSQLNVALHSTAFAAAEEVRLEAPDPRVEFVAKVQERYEDALFRVSEVVGIGIGAVDEQNGELGLVVYTLKNLSASGRSRIPRSIEGIPVRIVEGGEFKAF